MGIQEDEIIDPFPQYIEHYKNIKEQLPESLTFLAEKISLHDATLWNIYHEVKANILTIELDCYDKQKRTDHHVRLIYKDVQSFHSVSDPNKGLTGPGGYGDLGYDEIDMTADGTFEHRILFSTGIELQIRFLGFELIWHDQPFKCTEK